MTIKVALHHKTRYTFDRPIGIAPHEVRLRRAPHNRTPIESYSLNVKPAKHFLNWQQDPYGNWVARLVFPEKSRELEITVDLIADMTVINPFDFFVDPSAEQFPFVYSNENYRELTPYLEQVAPTPALMAWIAKARTRFLGKPISTIDLLIAVNHMVREDVNYLVRMEQGTQTPEETLTCAQGSCRDSAWLLVQILRFLGIAARFASGYLIQLAADVRLAVGGEPTFISIDDMEGAEWNYTAMSEKKLELSTALLYRLRKRFAPGGLLHFGQGKWYPGEPLPRWALSCFWRKDGTPLWEEEDDDIAPTKAGAHTDEDAGRLATELAEALELSPDYVIAAYEDPWRTLRDEANLPLNVDPFTADTATEAARRRLGDKIAGGIGRPGGDVLPLEAAARGQARGQSKWKSSPWPLRRGKIFLMEGDSAMGYRLPLGSLPEVLPEDDEPSIPQDPFDSRDALGKRKPSKAAQAAKHAKPKALAPGASREVVKTALCVEVRKGQLHIFLPPTELLEDFISLVSVIESTVQALSVRVRLEGYGPPDDPRLGKFAVTPDPGVIEVNIHPATDWDELKHHVETLYEEARLTRLGTEKFMLDGRHTGTGGGNHVTLGGPTAADSPMLRRPDVLKSLVTYWQHHPALSYLFSRMVIG